MNDETSEAPKPHTDLVVPDPVRDAYLAVILSMLEEDKSNKSALSVTLQVGGILVAGELIGHGRWRDELKAWLATIGGSSDVVSGVVDAVEQQREEADRDGPMHFLHLRDATFLTNCAPGPDGVVPLGPGRPLWRTRISDVQGWSLGRAQ